MPFDFFVALGAFIALIMLAVSAGCFYVAYRHQWWPFKIFMGLLGLVAFSVLAGVWSAAA